MDKRNTSIKNIIIIVFITFMVSTAGAIGYIVYSGWLASADETIAKMAKDMNNEIFKEVDAFLNVPLKINEANQFLIKNGILDINNEAERENLFVGVLKTQSEDVYSFSYGTETGEYYGARRNKNNVIEIMKNNAYTNGESWYYSVKYDLTSGDLAVKAGKFDPRTRAWYQAAKAAKKPEFSPIYKHFVMNDLTVSSAYPIYNREGKLQGVLGTHIILSKIDEYLKGIVKEKNAYAVIIEKNSEELVSNSLGMANFKTLHDGSIKRFTIEDINNKDIMQAYENYQNTNASNFNVKNEKDRLYVNLNEYNNEGLDWLVITAIPESLFMSDILVNMKLTLILTMLAILLSIAIYFKLTNKLLKPIDRLIDTSERFSAGDLTPRVEIVRNDEIGRLSTSFNKMADTMNLLVNNLEVKVKERTLEIEKTLNALKENKDELRLILDSAAEGIYGIDNNGNCTFCNTSCLVILGYRNQDELIGKNMHLLIHHTRRDGNPMPKEECKVYQAFNTGRGTHVVDEVFWKHDGTSFEAEYYSYPQFKGGEIVGSVVTFMDITERKKNEENIKYLSSHDSLTGLYNRMYFDCKLKEIDNKKNLPISIIFGDVNGLKLTNDIFGHTAGDTLLNKSAEILKKVCRAKDIVARVGGDEFVILMINTEAREAKQVISSIKKEFYKEKIIAIKGSMAVGCDTKASTDINIERTMENAENKMYKDKTLNRKTVNSDMIKTIIETLHERSPEQARHSKAVCEICRNIGRKMDLSEAEIMKLQTAGYLHDIGKIVLDERLLNKNGVFNEEEKRENQQHSMIGYRILNSFESTMDIAEAILAHHESWDGSGYPKGLKGEEIPKLARIIAVAENYDAMLNDPNNNTTMSKEEVISEIKNKSGVKFDPEIVRVMADI